MNKVIGEYFVKETASGSQLCLIAEADKYYRQEYLDSPNVYSWCLLGFLFAALSFVLARYIYVFSVPKRMTIGATFWLALGIVTTTCCLLLTYYAPTIIKQQQQQVITQDICLPLNSFDEYYQIFGN